jgi:hypothetical protein
MEANLFSIALQLTSQIVGNPSVQTKEDALKVVAIMKEVIIKGTD